MLFTEITATDHGGFTEPIFSAPDYHLIDSFTTIDKGFFIADSTNGRERAEGTQGKTPVGYIMQRLAGNWLNRCKSKFET